MYVYIHIYIHSKTVSTWGIRGLFYSCLQRLGKFEAASAEAGVETRAYFLIVMSRFAWYSLYCAVHSCFSRFFDLYELVSFSMVE